LKGVIADFIGVTSCRELRVDTTRHHVFSYEVAQTKWRKIMELQPERKRNIALTSGSFNGLMRSANARPALYTVLSAKVRGVLEPDDIPPASRLADIPVPYRLKR